MARKRRTPEEIIGRLQQDKYMAEAIKTIGVTEPL